MFGALNRFISRLDSDPTHQSADAGSGDSSCGFQVLRNTDPELPIEPWFDFIIGINGRLIDHPDPQLFATEVRNCAGHSLSLEIWRAKGQRTHTVTVAVPATSPSLGLTLQQAPLNAPQNIWHILAIPSPLSPAHLAALLPHSDYIIGTPSGTLSGEAALGELVEDHLNRTLVLWVYNSEFDVVREVELIPRRGWGGEGALGAVLGFGALHRLPVGLGEEVQGPGEPMFEAEHNLSTEKSFIEAGPEPFVPQAKTAQSNSQQPPPPPTPPPLVNSNRDAFSPMSSQNASSVMTMTGGTTPIPGRKAKNRGVASPNTAFDDMFEEGAKQSQEQDHATSGRKATPLPPPPKVNMQREASAATIDPTASPAPQSDGDIGEPGEAEAT